MPGGALMTKLRNTSITSPVAFYANVRYDTTFVSRMESEEAPITAELPKRLIGKGLYGAGLLSEIINGKYADHLPMDRQEKIFKSRYGVDVPKQSMSRAIEWVADSFQLIVEKMKRQQFATGAVQVDETSIRYLELIPRKNIFENAPVHGYRG